MARKKDHEDEADAADQPGGAFGGMSPAYVVAGDIALKYRGKRYEVGAELVPASAEDEASLLGAGKIKPKDVA